MQGAGCRVWWFRCIPTCGARVLESLLGRFCSCAHQHQFTCIHQVNLASFVTWHITQTMGTLWSGMVSIGFYQCSVSTKVCQDNIPHCRMEPRINVFHTRIQISYQDLRLVRPDTIFLIFFCPTLLSLGKPWIQLTGVTPGVIFCCFKVRHIVCSEMLFLHASFPTAI